MDTTNTNFVGLNCHGFKTNADYIKGLSESHEILFLSELWITEAEKTLLHNYNKDFNIYFQPANQGLSGRPYGGTALLIKKSLPAPELIQKNEYATIVKLKLQNFDLLVIGVYLQSTSSNSTFKDRYYAQLSNIGGMIKQFENTSETIILGDLQSCPSTHSSERLTKQNTLTEPLNEFINK